MGDRILDFRVRHGISGGAQWPRVRDSIFVGDGDIDTAISREHPRHNVGSLSGSLDGNGGCSQASG